MQFAAEAYHLPHRFYIYFSSLFLPYYSTDKWTPALIPPQASTVWYSRSELSARAAESIGTAMRTTYGGLLDSGSGMEIRNSCGEKGVSEELVQRD